MPGYGFDNIADVLSLSPVLMEKYVTAADRVARLALFGPPHLEADADAAAIRRPARRATRGTFPASYDLTGLSLPNAFHAVHRVPVDGEYVVRVVLGGARPAGSEPITVALWVDDQQVQSTVYDLEGAARFDLDRQDFGGQTTEFRVTLAGRRAAASPWRSRGSSKACPPAIDGPEPVDRRPSPSDASSRRRRTRRPSGSRS